MCLHAVLLGAETGPAGGVRPVCVSGWTSGSHLWNSLCRDYHVHRGALALTASCLSHSGFSLFFILIHPQRTVNTPGPLNKLTKVKVGGLREQMRKARAALCPPPAHPTCMCWLRRHTPLGAGPSPLSTVDPRPPHIETSSLSVPQS